VSDTDRALVRLHWPETLRPALDALLALDDAMAGVVLGASQPALAAITLAWWREALERLDHAPPPAEPRLVSAAAELLPLGISGRALSDLEGGWAALLEDNAGQVEAAARGRKLFALGARLLGGEASGAGAMFGQADLARRTGQRRWLGQPTQAQRVPRSLRPLTALDALAARDLRYGWPLEPEATPGRAWTLLRHRWTGRI
jgi:phytoene synthase